MEWDKTKLQRVKRPKRVSLSIKVTQEASKFMRDNNLSPTMLFEMALQNVGYKGSE